MKRKLEISELIFMIVSYVLLTVFALCCLYRAVLPVSLRLRDLRGHQRKSGGGLQPGGPVPEGHPV